MKPDAWMLALLATAAAAACTDLNPQSVGPDACTLIGCQDQVSVKFVRVGSFEYDATVTLDGKAGTFRCGAMGVQNAVGVSVARCDQTGFVVLGRPASLEVSVTCGVGPDDAGVVRCSGSLKPVYKTVQPNGPGCAPTCYQAEVTLQ